MTEEGATEGTTGGDAAVEERVVRYGVIGTGMMGVEHINNLLAIEGAAVVAAADPDQRSLDLAQHAVGIDAPLARFADHRQLLAAGECDAIVVATPNHTHRDILRDVLDSGVHVLVEKPLCTTVADCQAVIQQAADGPADRVVWMGLEYRYMPPTQRLVDEVGNGTVGNVRMVTIREHRFPFLHKVGNWNRFNAKTGGTLVEKCCHYFDLMNLVIGQRPRRVVASGAQDVNHLDECYEGAVPDVIDNAYVIIDYEGGVRAMLDLCMFAEASKNEQEITVVGDEGKVEALVSQSLLRIGRRADGIGAVTDVPVTDERVKFQGHHHGSSFLEHLDFLQAVRTGEPPTVTLEDGLWAVAIGEAGQRSIDEGRWVDVDELFRPGRS
jgi:myo-inositol 2-dehydrogenase/D-chiro-inositol 1-dehydrogenase